MENEKILIITIDRDNDLFEKAGISGPVIGRAKNLKSATELALIDPEEVDANTIFQAIKVYDKLSKTNNDIEICTLTGSAKLGYDADSNISQQLDHVLSQFPAKEAIVVTDGADDEIVLPIISSRIKINSVKHVYMKQSKELEKTYVAIIEKLRDPYYAKLIIGIPAVLFALLGITLYLHWGVEVFAILLSVVLFMRLFKIDERIYSFVKSFEFSVEKVSSILYFIGIIIIIFSLWIAQQVFYHSPNPYIEKRAAMALRSWINIVIWGILTLLFGKMLDSWSEKQNMMVILYGLYTLYSIMLWMISVTLTDWILLDTIPPVSFGDLFAVILYTIITGFVAVKIMNQIRISILKRMKLEDKVVISTDGVYIGRVKGVANRNNKIIIETSFGKKFSIPFSNVKNMVENRLFVKI
ncbi:DUF373 family protein [Candidatus Micrarchaeota archaeon]|nr:DUF373 family protein [Candidatus Micrarchaeota archaeon]